MHSVILPLVKCKGGNLGDVNNYRAIAISTAMSKVFETIFLSRLLDETENDQYQFGFKTGHSTTLCTSTFKRTVEYYRDRGSHVFTCFVDITKAFNSVNYWKLFNKLLDDDIDVAIVNILAFWYSNQEVCVRWQNTMSNSFTISNGIRQGGILSPMLFSRYIHDLLQGISAAGIGCNIGGIFYNILAYADDLVLLAPIWAALQLLLNLLCELCLEIDMLCNFKKTLCMIFTPKCRDKIVSRSFPAFKIGDISLQYVTEFKYLGHIISESFTDDADIKREICNMFVRTNILIRKYSRCSVSVKTALFKSFCLCLYDTALWNNFNICTMKKLKSCYNKCIKMFFGYKRDYSATQMLCELELPDFDTVLTNGARTFARMCSVCTNSIITHLCTILGGT